MGFPVLERVECAILHERFEPIDGDLILEAVRRLAAEAGYGANVNLLVTSTQKDIHVDVAGLQILVSQNAEPLSMEGFRTALTTPFTGTILPNATEVVQQHQANTFVTITKNILEVPPDLAAQLGDVMGDLYHFQTHDEAHRAMVLCRDLTRFIVDRHSASAIHWCTSDNLMSEKFFKHTCSANGLTLLGARPYFTSSTGRMGEGVPIGAVFNGSQWLIGKMLQFEEAPVPPQWMIEVGYNFINLCTIRGSIIGHNESFSVEGQDWTIGVYHEKIEGHTAWEMVKLVVVDAPQFGIHGDTRAKQQFHYENAEDVKAQAEVERRSAEAATDVGFEDRDAFDPENALDIALMEKLRQRKLLEEEVQKETKEPPKTPARPPNQNSGPWQGNRKSVSVSDLRAISRMAAEKDKNADEREQPGLVGRLVRILRK